MNIRYEDDFDDATLERGRDYAARGLVVKCEVDNDGFILSQVSNGRGKRYKQFISFRHGGIAGVCSCPMNVNCKHVVAVLIASGRFQDTKPTTKPAQATPKLAPSVVEWLQRVEKTTVVPQEVQLDPDAYPATVKDRLLYVLTPWRERLAIDTFKGRINAAGTGFNKSMPRYDAYNALRSIAPAKFIRPIDKDLLAALGKAGLWQQRHGYGYGATYPDVFRPTGPEIVDLLRKIAETGRLLSNNDPDAVLTWSENRPELGLTWAVLPEGTQKLAFSNSTGAPLQLYSAQGASIWVDETASLIGEIATALTSDALAIVEASPEIAPHQAKALSAALPAEMAGLPLPKPLAIKTIQREAERRVAKLVLGREAALDGPDRWAETIQLPTVDLSFVYDGQEVRGEDPDPVLFKDDEMITLPRDREWERACDRRVLNAGAIPIGELEMHWATNRLNERDYAFADGELSMHTLEICRERDALDFAFRVVPQLKAEGWEVEVTRRWPFKVDETPVDLAVQTERAAGEAFQGNDWFSLGFQAEVNGKAHDVAPLVTGFLRQFREDWDDVPSVEDLQEYLEKTPSYLDLGKGRYAGVDLSPLAPLLLLVLSYHAELGALHPSDATVARLAEEALAGSTVKFSDKAGIVPLARSLDALSKAEAFDPPAGLNADLRDYQAFGAAWMGTLMQAGFGAVLADDMGLGKTIQTLAVLQARREAGATGPALLIVPTSLLHGWQSQAAQFTPELQLVVLHGPDRAKRREEALDADLVITTYPLLARDADWLADQQWPLVILDEAQTLKNPASQMAKSLRDIPATGRVALTGTPLENSLQDLWTLIDWVNPGLLGDRKTFTSLFRTPIEKHGDAAAQARLNRRLRPFLLRRTKEEVAAELPPKTEILERVDLPKPQQALYEAVRSAMDERVRKAIADRGLARARITVLDALLKLRQVCCDPSLVKTKAAKNVSDSAKRERLRALLSELVAEGRRVLVFSQFVEMLRLIETDLNKDGVKTLTLTGSTTNRSEVLEAFSQGGASVFLLSLKAGGVGLTLTEADTVILYDPWWNPAVERQAMDRAHRIGQDKPVFVHRLVAAGTVEEKILDMQARKQALADALFDKDGTASETLLDEATLQDLFAPLAT